MFIRAIRNILRAVVSSSKAQINNMEWITPLGSLGEFYETETFEIQLEVQTNYAIERFTILDEDIPEYISLLPNGLLVGEIPSEIDENYDLIFTVRVVDIYENILEGEFSLTIKKIQSEVTWITPQGQIVELGIGQPIVTPIKAESNLL